MNIYFAGSIRGGRELQPRYLEIIKALQAEGHTVLSEHVGQENLQEQLTDVQIYERDMIWLYKSDLVIAEVTTPSLGVGFELGIAVQSQKTILCLAEVTANVSAMITGCSDTFLDYQQYTDTADAIEIAVDWVNDAQ